MAGAQGREDRGLCVACHLASSAHLCLLRPEKYWRYDPRFTGSFEDDLELHRDPFRDDGDRRSEHSDHSARSLGAPSRRSSFSTHSQQVGGAVGQLRARLAGVGGELTSPVGFVF